LEFAAEPTEQTGRMSWALPERYPRLTSREQATAIRASILLYLQAHGSAAKSVLIRELHVARPETVQKALDFLSTTQQVYLDATSGSRDPTYHSNGRLAHASGQRTVDCIRFQYVIRSYDDRWAGKAITVTQYAVMPSGDKKPLGGIRVDQEDVPELMKGLEETVAALRASQADAQLRRIVPSRGGS
jgi:hypothetical protein